MNATVPMENYNSVVDKFPGAGDTCRKDWSAQDELFYATIALNFTNIWNDTLSETTRDVKF